MSLINKFKAGVAEAGNKAKTVVEINRLKMQNSSKQNEIEQQYQEIGRLVFEAREDDAWPIIKEQLDPNMNRILQLKFEIEQNLLQIANLSDEKPCRSCGATVAIDVRFCPKCGHTFEIIDQPIEVNEEESQQHTPLLSERSNKEE